MRKMKKKNPDQPARIHQSYTCSLAFRLKSFPEYISELISIKNDKWALQKRLSKMFFVIGLCISLLFVITAFEWKFYNEGNLITVTDINSDFEDIIEVPITKQPPPPLPKIIQPMIIEVDDHEQIIEEIEVILDIEMTEDMIIEDIIDLFDDTDLDEKAEVIFVIVEQKPEPIGGYGAFYKHIGGNMKYPAIASRGGIEGRVFIQFIVDKDGSLTELTVIKGIGGGCDEEALRILSNAPKWNPGKQRGQPVKVKMILPILFKLE